MQISGKIICVHELEELKLLKYPYYTKWSTDAVQSLSKIPMAFFAEIEKKKKILKFV